MYPIAELKQNQDYFTPYSNRLKQGIYFCRYIGFDDDLMVFFRQYQIETQKKGLYLQTLLQNPTGKEVGEFREKVNLADFKMEKPYLKQALSSWVSTLPPKNLDSMTDALFEELVFLYNQGNNENILKNAFVKFMCWLQFIFHTILPSLGDEQVPKILYEGEIGKYEVHMLHILAKAGCDVLYVDFMSESSYLQADPTGNASQVRYGKRRGIPTQHFSKIDLSHLKKVQELEKKAEESESMVETNTWVTGSLLNAVLMTNSQRGVLNTTKVYNTYGRYLGMDEREPYLNRLYQWKEEAIRSGKRIILIEEQLGNPTLQEVKEIPPISYTTKEELVSNLALTIQIPQNKNIETIVQGALVNVLGEVQESNLRKLYNYGMKFVCWIARYTEVLFSPWEMESIPLFLYYGPCTTTEAEFLNFLSFLPIDVLYVSSHKEDARAFQGMNVVDRGKVVELPNSMPVEPFPQTEIKMRLATHAYEAEQELDAMMYQDTGLFREKQFTRSQAVTLKTTYEEIGLLWKEEAKYRPNFEAKDHRVLVPNIFAKISGVKDGNATEYFSMIQSMMTQKTVFIKQWPWISSTAPNPMKNLVHQFFKDGQILVDEIKRSSGYPYDYLNEDTQDYILEKMQELISLNWITADTMGVEYVILSTILNLDKLLVQLIQQFDFTREIPKLIVVDVDDKMPTLEDCITILFLNLVGFDIAVFTPTGNRNIEKHISRKAFEEYQIGPYLFDLTVPVLYPQQEKTKEAGFFAKLFGLD